MEWDYVAVFWNIRCASESTPFVMTCAQMREEGWEEYIRVPAQGGVGGACIMRRPKDEPRKLSFAEVSERLRGVWLKDELGKSTMDYQYVALCWTTEEPKFDAQFTEDMCQLLAEGWEKHSQARCDGGGIAFRYGGACILRRPIKHGVKIIFDQPHMWTEGEIEEIAANIYKKLDTEKLGYSAAAWGDMSGLAKQELVESILEDAQTEADMQTAYRKELQKRNERLQAGVDGQYGTIIELTRRVAKLQAGVDEVVSLQRNQGFQEDGIFVDDTFVLSAVREHLYPLATKEEET